MVKAEVISHEGEASPNWLDKCRSLVTPGSISLLIVVLAAAALGAGIYRNNVDQGIRSSSSDTTQPAAPARPLTVEQAGQSGLQPTSSSTAPLQSNTSATSITSGTTTPTAPTAPAVPSNSTGPAPQDSTERLQPQPSQTGADNLQGLNTTLNRVQSLASKLL